jgi:hypothetical protein
MLQRLDELGQAHRSLLNPALEAEPVVRDLLADTLLQRQELRVEACLQALSELGETPEALQQAQRLRRLQPSALAGIMGTGAWEKRLAPAVLAALRAGEAEDIPAPQEAQPLSVTLNTLEAFLQDRHALLQAAALFLLARLDLSRARLLARGLDPAASTTAPAGAPSARPGCPLAELMRVLWDERHEAPELQELPELEKRAHLATSDFFRRTTHNSLEHLAELADLRRFAAGDLITEAGDTCRELLLLIDGEAAVRYSGDGAIRHDPLRPGQVLDELEVLSHSTSENTIVAQQEGTRVLAVPVDGFDAVLERDPDFARRVLQLESRHIQKLTRSLQA